MSAGLAAPVPYLLAQTDPFQLVSDFLNSPALRLVLGIVILMVVAFWLALVYWTYADASRRDSWHIFWGAAAAVLPFVGTVIYLIVRPPEYLLDHRERELELAVLERQLRDQVHLCPTCRFMVEKDFLLCPECSRQLKTPCFDCQRPLNLQWKTCPYCEAVQHGSPRKRR